MNKSSVLTWLLGVLLASASLTACKTKQVAVPKMPEFAKVDSVRIPDASTFFNDQRLQQLLDQAVKHNPDYLALQAGVQSQRAELLARKNALLPNIDLFAGAGNRRFSEYSVDGVGNFDTNFSPNIRPDQRMPNPLPDYALRVQASWELDLWGRLNNMRKAAAYRYLGSESGLRWMRATLSAEVAQAYYAVLAMNEMQRIVSDNIGVQQTAVELVKLQQAAGRATALAVQQTEAQLFRTQALAAQVAADRLRASNQLQLLVGKYPQLDNDSTGLMGVIPPSMQKTGIPTAWLLQRPDLQQASLELSASGADVRSAQAAFFPRLVLTPDFGLHGFNASAFFDPASLAWQLAGGLTAPVFNQRMLKAGLMQAEARQKQALQQFTKTSLSAYNEVYEALLMADLLERNFQEKQREVNSLRQGVRTAGELFAAGYASYLEVIIAQNDVLAAEMELVRVQQARFQNTILLYKAVGGSW
ncbi:MAG: RND transporter [Sphingobacteriaceae bacterium]|nr:RND transporter [Sphingobacteriaceae bacterium]